jgi:hypothetical protein
MTIMGSCKPFITLLVCTPSIFCSFSQLTFLSFSPPPSQEPTARQVPIRTCDGTLVAQTRKGEGAESELPPLGGCSSGLQVSRTGTDRKKTGLSREAPLPRPSPGASSMEYFIAPLVVSLHSRKGCCLVMEAAHSPRNACVSGEQTAIP